MVIGQYKILQKIGEGGMGVIYKAEHCTLLQTVAIKALPGSLSSRPEIRERFLREATIQAKISHPNIVNVLNFFESDGNCYIVMEYVEGETLEAMIKRLGLIPPERCLALFQQILAGIHYAHQKGIIHRDIKPGNIMVTSQGAVKIMDFGIAKIAGGVNLTKAGVKVGTVWYMAPEQVKGLPASVSTDIYSLGVTLFQMITGRVPFYADSEFQVMKTIVETPPSSPKVFYPYIPEPLEKAILRALAKSPTVRFQDAQEFSLALTRQESTSLPHTRSGNPPAALRPFLAICKNVNKRSAGAVAACLITGGLVLFYNLKQDPMAPATPIAADGPRRVVPSEVQAVPAAVSTPDRIDDAKRSGIVRASGREAGKDKAAPGNKLKGAATSREAEKIRNYLGKGEQYHEDGEFAKAREMYHKVLDLDQDNKAARTGIAYTYLAEKALQAR